MNFFPQRPETNPMIYAYQDTNPQYAGLLKVGYTSVDVEKRVAEQYPTKRPDGSVPYRIVFAESAMYPDGTSFSDHDVHRMLTAKGIQCVGGEWFRCDVQDVKAAVIAVRNRTVNIENRTRDFAMRPEQQAAVDKTIAYFDSLKTGEFPRFLWNAKMRFGKTFATYQLAKKKGFKRVLILTFKPAVQSAWEEDLNTHVDFEGWQFICRPHESGAPNIAEQYEKADKDRPIVCFGSFQDFLGIDKATGCIKEQHKWVREIEWDLVVFDEYHFGAWRDNAKKLFDVKEDDDSYDSFDAEEYASKEMNNALDETWLPITAKFYLYLSGTPFRALNNGEFVEDQIYSWTYTDEQRAKENYQGENNPYAALPRMVMMTYKIPDSITEIAKQGEFDEFDLNVFFSAEGTGKDAVFKYKDYVQKWLDLIRGAYLGTTTDELKLGARKPDMPYGNAVLLSILTHTLWLLPNVASCHAMANLLAEKQNVFYHDYKVIVCAGASAGIGVEALKPVYKAMGDPLKTKTITLSCGKLTTGVTIRPWTGIFMLRNLKSPETYFQAAFRVQSPWEIDVDSTQKEILKQECYIFDFALNRALMQIKEYAKGLNVNGESLETNVAEFTSFLPVLAYDGSAMKQINAAEILDITMAGTSATLLARRWQSALLVNVTDDILKRLLGNKEALEALMKIEGFRTLNKDIETIIIKSEHVKEAKKDDKPKTDKEKKILSDEEKEYKSKRKEIQEKLIKFATRVPIFMYLTDYREQCLKDVITQLEPGLFKKVTGLDVKDFNLLVSLGVFNGPVMNDAVWNFRRYEDSSLSYTGIDRHAQENVGLWDTSLGYYESMAKLLGESEIAEKRDANDRPEILYREYSNDDEQGEPTLIVKRTTPTEHKVPTAQTTIVGDFKKSIAADNIDNNVSAVLHSSDGSTKQNSIGSMQGADNLEDKKTKIIDLSPVVVGANVIHKAFGKGIIVSLSNNYVNVAFGDLHKAFQYPNAFIQGFLSVDM